MTDEVSDDACEHFRIAEDYQAGSHGRPKDAVQAAIHMTKAAEGGHHLATYNVCAFYLNGQAVPKDLDRARAWAQKLRVMGSTEFADHALAAIDATEKGLNADGSDRSATTAPRPDRGKVARRELAELGKSVATTLLGICLLAAVGYCSGGHLAPDDEGLDELPDQVRKP